MLPAPRARLLLARKATYDAPSFRHVLLQFPDRCRQSNRAGNANVASVHQVHPRQPVTMWPRLQARRALLPAPELAHIILAKILHDAFQSARLPQLPLNLAVQSRALDYASPSVRVAVQINERADHDRVDSRRLVHVPFHVPAR